MFIIKNHQQTPAILVIKMKTIKIMFLLTTNLSVQMMSTNDDNNIMQWQWMDSDLWSSFRYCSNINLIFFCWQYPGLENCISEHPKPFVSWRTVRHKITYTIRERKIILKGKLTSYSHKWKPSNHEELVVFLGLLTIIMRVINMSRPESMLEYQRLVVKAHQFFEAIFTGDRRLLMFHSIPYRKNYMGNVL